MSLFVPLDVDYQDDEKIIAAGALAELLYVRGLAFAKKGRKDGLIYVAQLPRLTLGIPGASFKHAERLVNVGLWSVVSEGWVITAWRKRNRSASSIDAEANSKRMGALKANHTRWHHDGIRSDDCPFCDPEPIQSGSDERSEPDPETDNGRNPYSRDRAETETETEQSSVPDLRSAIDSWTGQSRRKQRDDLAAALAQCIAPARTGPERATRKLIIDDLLLNAHATPDQVYDRCDEYIRRWPDVTLTDSALRRHWSSLGIPQSVPAPKLTGGSQAIMAVGRRIASAAVSGSTVPIGELE